MLFDAICGYFWYGVGCSHVFLLVDNCQEVFNKQLQVVCKLSGGFNLEKYYGDHCSGCPIDSPCIFSHTTDDPANSYCYPPQLGVFWAQKLTS